MLTLGAQKISALRLGAQEVKKAYLGEALIFGGGEQAPSRLPVGYTEVEYIESSGTQHIDTGVKPTATTKIAMDVEPMNAAAAVTYFFYSYAYQRPYYYRQFLSWATSGVCAYWSGFNGTNVPSGSILSMDRSPRRLFLVLDGPNKIASANDETITATVSTYSGYGNVFLLGTNTGANRISAKLYSCQLYTNNISTRDFVPCIDPTGAVGLYDLVEGKFYGNAGTGTFTAGPAV